MADLINEKDSLNTGRGKLNKAIQDSETALNTANQADQKATEALSNSESTQTQLDQIVIDGDSSVEAAQARVDADGNAYDTLKDRLDAEYVELKNNYKSISKPIICFTFDDGYIEDDLAFSILKEYGYVGCFSLITDSLYDTSKNPLSNYAKYENEGFEVLSHTSTHVDARDTAPALSNAEVEYEYKTSAEKLRILGFQSRGLAVPFSDARQEYLDFAKQYYDFVLLGGSGLNNKNSYKNKELTRVSQYVEGVEGSKKLIDQAIQYRSLLIFYDHRIGQTGSLNEAEFREILDYLKTKTDNDEIEVCNLTEAISKYYGKKLKDYPTISSNDVSPHIFNYSTSTEENKWYVSGATPSVDSNFEYDVLRLTIPTSSTEVILSTIYNFPSFEELGERVDFKITIWGNNSEADNFTSQIEIDFLSSNNSILFTETKPISISTNKQIQFSVISYNRPGIDISSIKGIRIRIRMTIDVPLTTQHLMRITQPHISFGSYSALAAPMIFGTIAAYERILPVAKHMYISNEGATESKAFRLPETKKSIGNEYTFVVVENQNLSIIPYSAEQIRGTTSVDKHITSNNIGDTVTLVCVKEGWWDIKHQNGTWFFN